MFIMERKNRDDYKTIWVHKKTHKQLTTCGNKDETYDDILKKMIRVYRKYKDVYEQETNDMIDKNIFSVDGKLKV